MALRVILSGEDDFALGRRVAQITEQFQRRVTDGELTRIQAERPFDEVMRLLCQPALFQSRRLLILDQYISSLSTGDWKTLGRALAMADEQTSVVVAEPQGGTKRSKSWQLEGYQEQRFPKASVMDRQNWLKGELQRRKIVLPTVVRQYFDQIAQRDPWSLLMELDKLEMAQRAGVQVDSLVLLMSEVKVFELSARIGKRQTAQALATLHQLEGADRHPLEILGYLAAWTRQLVLLSSEERPAGITIPPFAINREREIANRLGRQRLVQAFLALNRLDLAYKLGECEGYGPLHCWVFRLTK